MDTSVANNGEFVVTPRQYNRYNIWRCRVQRRGGSNIQSDTRRVSILILQTEWYWCGGQEQDTDLVIMRFIQRVVIMRWRPTLKVCLIHSIHLFKSLATYGRLMSDSIICICKILLVTCVQLSVATLARLIGIDNHLPSSAHAGGKVCPNIFGARLIYF